MNEKLNDALNEISDKHIEEAAKRKRKHPYWVGAVAAILVIAVLAGIWGRIPFLPGSTNPPVLQDPTQSSHMSTMPSVDLNVPHVSLLASPTYPAMVKYPQGESDSYQDWSESQQAQYNQPEGYVGSLNDFFADSIRQFLQGEGNQAYSPVNVYMAMAMLAEASGGTSRQQLLELLGADSIASLREQAGYVWNAHYSNDGLTTLLLANSLWLDNVHQYNENTVTTLAGSYYASSFCGDLGTEEMNQQLRSWLSTNTGNFLQEQIQSIELDPESVAALASTVCFSAQWEDAFSEGKTVQSVFHAPDGDKNVPFMNRTFSLKLYFRGDNYGALSLDMSGNNTMWLILPDEGTSTSDLLESGEFFTMLQDTETWENKQYYDVHLSLPKFDISSQNDLIEGMKKLGVTEVFDPGTADLSDLITDTAAYVGQIDHAVRVAVDEEGCIAAAYTVIGMPGTGMPQDRDEIDFILDRPFLFVVSSRDNLPLFAGVVSEP